MPLTYFLNNLWLWKCGLEENNQKPKPNLDFEDLKKSEWSAEFEALMRNRLIFGAIRYGKLGAKNKPKYNRADSIVSRLNKYLSTGNKEFLVDIANLCLIEFVESEHPNEHFKSIDDGEHVRS